MAIVFFTGGVCHGQTLSGTEWSPAPCGTHATRHPAWHPKKNGCDAHAPHNAGIARGDQTA